jgi:predicted DNA binding protein
VRAKKKYNDSLKTAIDDIIKDPENLIIESENVRDGKKSYYVLLKKNLKKAVIEKVNPKNSEELVVSYYSKNKLCYDIITAENILPINSYEKIKNRNNRINKILK